MVTKIVTLFAFILVFILGGCGPVIVYKKKLVVVDAPPPPPRLIVRTGAVVRYRIGWGGHSNCTATSQQNQNTYYGPRNLIGSNDKNSANDPAIIQKKR
jgi:hypothetical protein